MESDNSSRLRTMSVATVYLVTQQIRRLDKLVDEIAKGRPMEKILRT